MLVWFKFEKYLLFNLRQAHWRVKVGVWPYPWYNASFLDSNDTLHGPLWDPCCWQSDGSSKFQQQRSNLKRWSEPRHAIWYVPLETVATQRLVTKLAPWLVRWELILQGWLSMKQTLNAVVFLSAYVNINIVEQCWTSISTHTLSLQSNVRMIQHDTLH